MTHILTIRNKHGKLIYRRYQQYFTKWLGFAFYKWETNFNIDNHVRNQCIDVNEANKFDYVLTQYEVPFEKESSLWDITLIPNYNNENKTMLLLRQNHGICDGMSMLKLITSRMMNLENPILTLSPKFEKIPVSKQIKSFCKNIYGNTIGLPRRYLQNAPPPQNLFFTSTPIKSSDEGRYWMSTTPGIPLSDIKNLRSELQVTFTSAVVNALSTVVCKHIKRYFPDDTKQWIGSGWAVPKPGHPDDKLVNFL